MNHPISIADRATRARTPYHELGNSESPTVPTWAGRRSVYRAAGRTMYLVETDHISSAQRDLNRLKRRGWNVQITATGKNAASVALSRESYAQAA